MNSLFASLCRHRGLVADFVVRDLKARYVGSSMGFFWSVIFPIVNLFVFMFVFRLVLKARWGDASDPSYLGTGGTAETALVMLAGILSWAAFSETLSRSTNCLVENANLIQKVVFPSEILPPYLALSSAVNMLVGIPIVLLGVIGFTDLGVGPPLLAVPLLLVLQIAFTVGLGWMLAALNVLVRDTYHVIGVALTVWMFATPIFYPALMVRMGKVVIGDTWVPLGPLLELNPMHWLIDSWQRVLVFDHWPQWDLVGRFALAALFVLLVGGALFRDQRRRFPDLL